MNKVSDTNGKPEIDRTESEVNVDLLVRLPDDFEEIELGMSNFDGQIDEGFAEALKNKKTFGRHAAWNFNGLVYYLNGKFNTDVWVYGSYQETFSEDTLEELMASANAEYGSA